MTQQDATNVGDEGGFAPNILSNFEGLELLGKAIEKGIDILQSRFSTVISWIYRKGQDRYGCGCIRILQGWKI
jgi:enolase